MSAAAVVAVGTGLQLYSQYKGNLDRAGAERKNAQFYGEQAGYIEEVGARKLKLLATDQKKFIGRQRSMFAAAGIDFSGSALDVAISTQVSQAEELRAMARQTEVEARLARMKAEASNSAADAYADPTNNLLTGLGTGLSNFSRTI